MEKKSIIEIDYKEKAAKWKKKNSTWIREIDNIQHEISEIVKLEKAASREIDKMAKQKLKLASWKSCKL
jgi:hypothetical protein